MRMPLYEGHDSPRNLQKSMTSHKGLWFERFFNEYDNDWSVGDNAKKNWVNGVSGLCGDKTTLTSHSLAQKQLCDDLQGISKIFKNNWHFVTGMGNNHPVENGMLWHPTLGTPYLSGASVKGLLRSWMEEWSDLEDSELKEKLFRWFGSDDKDPKQQQKESQAGGLVFFDAIPVEQVKLTCDIMTPHMGEWYSEGGKITKDTYSTTLPADWHNPIPIPFLVVKQASLQFSIAPRPHTDISQDEIKQTMDELTKALEYLGAGAKTAVGYGRFEVDTDADEKQKKDQKKESRAAMIVEGRFVDHFIDELIDIEDKGLAEMFGKRFNNPKEPYEKEGCNWDDIIDIFIKQKRSLIESWSEAGKNTAQGKAYKKLKPYL